MSTDTKNIAKIMMWLTWLIVIGLLTLFFNDFLENEQNPNRSVYGTVTESGIREVTLERNRQGHYLSAGFINGHAVVFLLDTGASDVAIPAGVAKRIGLTGSTPIRYKTANGTTIGYLTKLDTISVGNIELTNIRGGINPSMKDEYILLGMTFLKHLEFTQRGNKLILRQYAGDQ